MTERNIIGTGKGENMTNIEQRLRTSAHINRIFAKKAAAGAEDTKQPPAYYEGKAEAFTEAADLLAS